mgnify:CR=1 FL=1
MQTKPVIETAVFLPEEWVSISKIEHPAGERDKLRPTEYAIDFFVQINGALKVGEDYTRMVTPKASVDPWVLLALALSKLNNVTVASIVTEAEATSPDEQAKIVKKEAENAITAIKAFKAEPKISKGPVTGSVGVRKIAL